MTYLWGVAKADVARAWPLIEDLVRAACASTQLHPPEAVFEDLIEGKTQLWVAWSGDMSDMIVRACLVTKIEKRESAQWCRAILVAGQRPNDWFGHVDTIERWAKTQGATSMNFIGRCGLEKWLKPKGYHRTHFLMEKVI